MNIIRDASDVGIDFLHHVFASQGYLAASSEDYGWLVSETFVLPFYIDRILFIRRMIFTNQPIPLMAGVCSEELQLAFINAVVDRVERSGLCDYISKPQSNAVFDVAPQRGVFCPWGTFETKINCTDEDLLKSFHSKHRNVIGKAIRDGVSIRPIFDLIIVHDNIRATLLRQKLPYYPSLEFVQNLVKQLPNQVLIMGAYWKDALQGVALVPFDSQRGYYLYGGSIENPTGGSLNLLQYEIMRQLRDRGVSVYDFVGARLDVDEGSKYEGIQRFKSRFGAELHEGKAFRVVFSRFKFFLFQFMLKTYFYLRGLSYIDPIDLLRSK